MGGLIYAGSYYIDYEVTGHLIKAKLEGRAVTCLDLPEDVWRRVTKCNPILQEIEEMKAELRALEAAKSPL